MICGQVPPLVKMMTLHTGVVPVLIPGSSVPNDRSLSSHTEMRENVPKPALPGTDDCQTNSYAHPPSESPFITSSLNIVFRTSFLASSFTSPLTIPLGQP